MNNKTILRILIVLEIVFGLIGIIIDLSLESYLPHEFQQYITRTNEADLTAIQIFGGVVAVPVIFGQIVAWIGLWKLWKELCFHYAKFSENT